jgi:pilus assembly protein CpaB
MVATAASATQHRGNRRAFILAAVFGLAAAALSLAYLNSTNKSGGDAATIVTVPALVAARDIPSTTVIKEGMVQVKMVPVDTRLNTTVTEKQAAIGMITRVPIAQGEQILRGKIADQVRDVGFSANVPQGKRAVAVGVTEVIASGGHLGVGDYVDVIGVFEVVDPNAKPGAFAANGQGDKPKIYSAVTLLQNVQVLAVAQKADPTIQTDAKGGDTKKVDSSEAKSVTLALSPEQAEKIFLAEETGKLRLSLRPFGEDEQRKIEPVFNSLGELVGQ